MVSKGFNSDQDCIKAVSLLAFAQTIMDNSLDYHKRPLSVAYNTRFAGVYNRLGDLIDSFQLRHRGPRVQGDLCLFPIRILREGPSKNELWRDPVKAEMYNAVRHVLRENYPWLFQEEDIQVNKGVS